MSQDVNPQSVQDAHGRYRFAWVGMVAAAGGFLFGYDTAVVNGANQYLSAHFQLNSMQEGVAAASAILGAIPGALAGGTLSDRYGRKRVLTVCAILFAIAGFVSAWPSELSQFLIARFFSGIAIGMSSIVCPVYVSECAPIATRGRMGTLFQLGIVSGILVTFFINAAIAAQGDLAWNQSVGWRWMLGVEVLPAMVLLALLPLVPESPRWLLQQGREPEARSILRGWLFPTDVEHQVNDIRAVTQQESGLLRELLQSRFRRPLIIAVGVAVIAQLSGINAVMYYSTRIFAAAGVGQAFGATVLIGCVNLLFTLVALVSMDSAGRRTLLLVGCLLQVVSLSAVAWLLAAGGSGILLLSAVLLFIAAFAMALGPIPWILGAEVFPARVRGRAMSVVSFSVWVSCYVVAQTFPMLNDSPAIGPARTFALYAAISAIGLVFTWGLVPETKGRSLEEIEASWSAG